ncbi:hypothetical protein DL768_002428 [Monosporascus sp. mg162]|nr:hypothetical protein DL768_002428 [Monosporascus sp. mg162]
MTDLASRIGNRNSKIEWENPKECIGEKQGEIQSGKYTCWRPIGRAKDAWNDLRPKIKEFLGHFGGGSSLTLLMLEMYMTGHTDETASPTIFICSEDKDTRKKLRKAIKASRILSGYCGIGLGDTPVLPDRRRIQPIMDPVHSDSDETAGSLLDLYATTCGSHFPEPLSVTDSDSEGESLIAEASNSTSLPAHEKGTVDGEVAQPPDASQTSTDRWRGLFPWRKVPLGISQSTSQKSSNVISTTPVVQVGKMSMSSEDGRFPSLDYALIEIEVPSSLSRMITFANGDTKISVEIKRESKIGPLDAAILAITASGGVLTGRLSSLASVMRTAGKTTFQEVYPVQLDGQVNIGDCGSAVIDRSTGQFYGHITAGTPGTGFAYIIPAVDVLKDLEGRSGDKPQDEVYAAALCVGGLRFVEKLLEIRGYNSRRAALDTWYQSLSRPQNDTKSSKSRSSTQNTKSLAKSGLSVGQPMPPLSKTDADLLLSDLPALQSIWLPTAEALLIQRRIVENPQDIRDTTQVMMKLTKDFNEEETERWYGLNKDELREVLEGDKLD